MPHSRLHHSGFAIRPFLAVLACALALGACSSKDKDLAPDDTVTVPVDQLYNEAKQALADKEYKKAVEKFETVEQQHPYSKWATNAQVMAAYTNYKQEEYDAAVALLERFVRMHPGNELTPYAYYLIGLCYYEQISDVGREQSMTSAARKALNDVVQRFPESEYARDAKLKLDLVTDHLAGKEMSVGRYYLKRGEVLSAINRFKYVVENYQTTTHVPEALHRLVEAYLSLGIEEEARRYAAVLGYNYPDSIWYRDSYRMLVGAPEGGSASDSPEQTKSFWKKWLPDL